MPLPIEDKTGASIYRGLFRKYETLEAAYPTDMIGASAAIYDPVTRNGGWYIFYGGFWTPVGQIVGGQNVVLSVNGKTGVVILYPQDIGTLSTVDIMNAIANAITAYQPFSPYVTPGDILRLADQFIPSPEYLGHFVSPATLPVGVNVGVWADVDSTNTEWWFNAPGQWEDSLNAQGTTPHGTNTILPVWSEYRPVPPFTQEGHVLTLLNVLYPVMEYVGTIDGFATPADLPVASTLGYWAWVRSTLTEWDYVRVAAIGYRGTWATPAILPPTALDGEWAIVESTNTEWNRIHVSAPGYRGLYSLITDLPTTAVVADWAEVTETNTEWEARLKAAYIGTRAQATLPTPTLPMVGDWAIVTDTNTIWEIQMVTDPLYIGQVADEPALPTGTTNGEWAEVLSTNTIWEWDGIQWVDSTLPFGSKDIALPTWVDTTDDPSTRTTWEWIDTTLAIGTHPNQVLAWVDTHNPAGTRPTTRDIWQDSGNPFNTRSRGNIILESHWQPVKGLPDPTTLDWVLTLVDDGSGGLKAEWKKMIGLPDGGNEGDYLTRGVNEGDGIWKTPQFTDVEADWIKAVLTGKPLRPYGLYPPDDSTDVPKVVTFNGTPYESPVSTQMRKMAIRVSTSSAMSPLVFEKEYEQQHTYLVPNELWVVMQENTDYWWQIAYQDDILRWSDWSPPLKFTTQQVFPALYIVTPNIKYPREGGQVPGDGVHINSTLFEVYGGTGTEIHGSSNWEISEDDTFSTLIYGGVDDPTNLTNLYLPVTITKNTYGRVKYKEGNTGVESAFSPHIMFRPKPVYEDALIGIGWRYSEVTGYTAHWIDEQGNDVSLCGTYFPNNPLYMTSPVVLAGQDMVSVTPAYVRAWTNPNPVEGEDIHRYWISPYQFTDSYLHPAFVNSTGNLYWARAGVRDMTNYNSDWANRDSYPLYYGTDLSSTHCDYLNTGADAEHIGWDMESIYDILYRILLLMIQKKSFYLGNCVSFIYDAGHPSMVTLPNMDRALYAYGHRTLGASLRYWYTSTSGSLVYQNGPVYRFCDPTNVRNTASYLEMSTTNGEVQFLPNNQMHSTSGVMQFVSGYSSFLQCHKELLFLPGTMVQDKTGFGLLLSNVSGGNNYTSVPDNVFNYIGFSNAVTRMTIPLTAGNNYAMSTTTQGYNLRIAKR